MVISVLERIVIAYWRKKDPVTLPARQWTMAPGDNVQRTMNLIMPLRDDSPKTKAELAAAMIAVEDELVAGLDNIGTVHFARFDIIGDRLSMISVYDGDFSTYIRDFIVTIGSVFNLILEHIAEPLPPLPCEEHVDAFVDWVDSLDILQIPHDLSQLGEDLSTLPRKVVLLFDASPQSQLGVYRGYPGWSVAQIRKALGVGW